MLAAMARVKSLPSPIERLRPAACQPPLGQSCRSGKCAGLALQDIEVVFQIEDLLLTAIAAFIAVRPYAYAASYQLWVR